MDSTKKISFGFNKLNKKPNILINKEPVKEENSKVQLIEYLEEQSIKVIGDENNVPAGPLIIPMKTPNKKLINLVDIVKNDFKDTVEDGQEKTLDSTETNKDDKSLTLDELAAKELINGTASDNTNNDVTKVIEVPATEKVTFEGEKESSLDDYESIPIEQFGKAMLRGMGWKDGQGIGKNQQIVKMAQPVIRPKGMGLGADSITKKSADTPAPVDRNGKVLTCVKGAYVKVIAGYHKGNYGQILGFDDESGRFIIKLTLTNINVSLNEFLVTPVTKEEYNKNSKVLNNAKYEEYLKNKELKDNQKQIKREPQNSDEENYSKITVKKEPVSESSEDETSRKNSKQQIKKEKDSDEDIRRVKREQRSRSHEEYKKYRYSKHKSKEYSKNDRDYNERKNTEKNKSDRKKYSDNDSESEDNRTSKKDKYDSKEEYSKKKSSKKEKYDSNDEYFKKKSSKKDKYDSNDEYSSKKSSKKDRKVDTRSKKSSKKDKYKADSDSEYESMRSSENNSKEKKRNSSKKRYSDSESEDRNKKSTKSKKQYASSEDDSEKYERKSRKHERNRKYNDSESENDERYERKYKKDKYRDRSKHSTKDRRR